MSQPLNFIIIGASGDLAQRKIIPALFALFCQHRLPKDIRITGFARTNFSHEEFRDKIMENLTCRYTPNSNSCATLSEEFLNCCFYQQGTYGDPASYQPLPITNKTTYYLAIPASIVKMVTTNLSIANHLPATSQVIVEKPFGYDRQSSDELGIELAKVMSEKQIYRIDHYLGKEIVQNILVMRFANLIFEPIWNTNYIEQIDICWQESIGTNGRGGYFDKSGIIRDVIQNHLLQVLALITMEKPALLDANSICHEKTKLLQKIAPPTLRETTLGQYPEYLDDPTVPNDSHCATYAKVKLQINTPRWQDTPCTITAGKGLKEQKTEIRIRFKPVPENIFCTIVGCPEPNELVIRIQPNEGIQLHIINKVPGMKLAFHNKDLDLSYNQAFPDHEIPDAYESLLLDAINGDKTLFIQSAELAAAWDIFTPLLHEIENKNNKPLPYEFGSQGPQEKNHA